MKIRIVVYLVLAIGITKWLLHRPISFSEITILEDPLHKQLQTPEGFQKRVESANSPIEFYGRIIDQYSNPVPGIKIKMGSLHWSVAVPGVKQVRSESISFERTSDSDGRFEVSGATGSGLGIYVEKTERYSPSPKAPNASAPTAGSFENPVVFKMWKIDTREPLIFGEKMFGIDSGKTYTLDLIAGKKLLGEAEGDLQVSITRPDGVKPRDKFPWSFSIEVLRGGFLEPDSNDEFMYKAPESGYQPKLEMQFDPSNPAWIGIVKKQFFIRSRDGKVYGRVNLEIISIYNVHSAIRIEYTINPNDSRNLQP